MICVSCKDRSDLAAGDSLRILCFVELFSISSSSSTTSESASSDSVLVHGAALS